MPGPSAGETYTYETYGKEIKLTDTINSMPRSFGQFGEVVEFNTGSLVFNKTLVELRGNNNLRVAADFILSISDQLDVAPYYKFTRALPYLQGIHSEQRGWVVGSEGAGFTTQRCSHPSTQGVASIIRSLKPQRYNYYPEDYWDGNQLVGVEGGGLIYRHIDSWPSINGLNTPWQTNGGWLFSCYILPDGSEGFIGHSPDGMKYYFGIPVAENGGLSIQSNGQGESQTFLDVMLYKMYVTKIEDRFGNWVKYEPNRIISNDGRVINFNYTDNSIAVTANDRSWNISMGVESSWVRVVNPDQSIWSVSQSGNISPYPRSPVSECQSQVGTHAEYTGQIVILITLESGLKGTFTLQPRRHGYSYVGFDCRYITPYVKFTETRNFVDEISLVSRVVEGPAVLPSHTFVDYGPVNACFTGVNSPDACANDSPDTRTVTATESDGSFVQYVFGNRMHVNSGLLLSKNISNLRADLYKYEQVHANSMGWGKRKMYSVADYSINVVKERITVQSGRKFLWQIASDCGNDSSNLCIDEYFRPIKIIKSSMPSQ